MALSLDRRQRDERRLAEREQRILANRQAFDDLMSLCKFVPARDEKKELEESREERFGNAYMD